MFVNREGGPEFIGIRIGFFGMKTVLIPVQFVESVEQPRTFILQ